MKKKKIVSCIAILLALSIFIAEICSSYGVGRAENKSDTDFKSSYKSVDDSDWQVFSSGKVIIKNQNITLTLDAATTHFNIIAQGNTYYSVPELSEDQAASFNEDTASELSLLYYDKDGFSHEFTSFQNSVKFNAFRVLTNGESIRVYYTLRDREEVIYIPSVISEVAMKEKIESVLSKQNVSYIKTGYTLYRKDSAKAKSLYEQYPGLENENLYIKKDTVPENRQTNISDYLKASLYTPEFYQEELERIGIQNEAEIYPEFVIPIEYSLSDDGFTCKILMDRVEATQGFDIVRLTPLENFSAFSGTDGYFLYPDGSGSVISFDQPQASSLTRSVYGSDAAIASLNKTQSAQNIILPVYGQSAAGAGYFACIEGGAAVADICVETRQGIMDLNRIYTSFQVASTDTTDIGAMSGKNEITLISDHRIYENPAVRYFLLSDDNNSYSDMANIYRESLVESGVFTERIKSESTDLFLDFTGVVTNISDVQGFEKEKKIVLSTVSEIEKTVNDLHSGGISSMKVRLDAIGNNGYLNSVVDNFNIDRKVGTSDELKSFGASIASFADIYINANFSSVYDLTDSFVKRLDGAKTLERKFVRFKTLDTVTLKETSSSIDSYVVAPIAYNRIISSYKDSFGEKLDNSFYHSWASAGKTLVSDFNTENVYDRCMSEAETENAIKKLKGDTASFMTDGGNFYTFGISDSMVNIPLSNSGFSIESYSVPFWQMVSHGYINYAGAPFNMQNDKDKEWLNIIESGAGLYYSVYTGEDTLLNNTVYRSMSFPTSVTHHIDKIIEQYQELNGIMQTLRDQTIIDHQRIADETAVVTYENGTRICVNYGGSDYDWEGTVVEEKSYAVKEAAQQ